MTDSWMDQADDEQIEYLAQVLDFFKRSNAQKTLQDLKRLIVKAWREEISRETNALVRRNRQEFHLKLLSFLRFSCPQSWILSRFGSKKGIFYKLYLNEPTDTGIPHAPGPRYTGSGTPSPKQFAFHAFDFFILTGKLRDWNAKDTPSRRSFKRFKSSLKSTFKTFVHGGEINSNCRTTDTGAIFPYFATKV